VGLTPNIRRQNAERTAAPLRTSHRQGPLPKGAPGPCIVQSVSVETAWNPVCGVRGQAVSRLLLICLSLALLLGLAACAMGPGRGIVPAPKAGRPDLADLADLADRPGPPAGSQPGSLFDARGRPVSYKDFAALAACHDYILLGESHSSRCDHKAQAALLRVMAEAGTRPVVGLEMVDVTRQDVLDRFADDILDTQVVERHLEWQSVWGFGFDLYEPIFLVAQEYDLPMVALNLPREIVSQVSAGGLESLNPEEEVLLPEEIIPPPGEQAQVLDEVFALHSSGEDMDEEELRLRRERFFLIQSLWDSKMAEQAVEARRNFARPVAVVAGAGHVESGWGIAHRLKSYDPRAKVLLVLPWRGQEPPAGARVFFYCPPTHHSSMGMVLRQEDGRVIVSEVTDDSRAGNAGLEEGDIITMAGSMAVTSLSDLHRAGVEAHRAGKPLTLVVLREGKLLKVDLGRLGQGKGKVD